MYALEHFIPLGHVYLGGVYAQLAADYRGEVALLKHYRRFVKNRESYILDNAVGLDVAEHRDLLKYRLLKRLVAAQDDDIGLNAHALKLLDGVLSGLRLMLV